MSQKPPSIETDATTARTLPTVPPEQVLTPIELDQWYMFHQGFRGTGGSLQDVNLLRVHVGDGWCTEPNRLTSPCCLWRPALRRGVRHLRGRVSRRSARWRSQSSSTLAGAARPRAVTSRSRSRSPSGRELIHNERWQPLPFSRHRRHRGCAGDRGVRQARKPRGKRPPMKDQLTRFHCAECTAEMMGFEPCATHRRPTASWSPAPCGGPVRAA
jgi:hypothetical protein